MDDLLVIILTLVFAVVGAIGQINKKKQNQKAKPDNENKNNFWNFLDDEQVMNENQTENIKQQEFYTEPEPVAKPEEKQYTPKYQFKAENEGTSIYKNDLTSGSGEIYQKDKKEPRKRKRDFSLRKAVIYSEILNRKYQ